MAIHLIPLIIIILIKHTYKILQNSYKMTQEQFKDSNKQLPFQKNMKICNEIYWLAHKLGQGNFGAVFLGILTPEHKKYQSSKLPFQVAIKIQRQKYGQSTQLKAQADLYKKIHNGEIIPGFPVCYEDGIQKGHYYMITQLLGPSLSDLLKLCGGKFSLQTTICLGIQMFERLEILHQKGYVYRDIKPENFLMGVGEQSSHVYLIDFGLVKSFRDQKTRLHRPYKENIEFNGNLRYASISSHLRIEQSQRDDLESLCYLLISFVKGELPWQNLKNHSIVEQKQKWIMQKKMKTPPEQLYSGLPSQFKNIVQYCLNLQFSADPDYSFIENQFSAMYGKYCEQQMINYDWALVEAQKKIKNENITIILSQPKQQNQNNKLRQSKLRFK